MLVAQALATFDLAAADADEWIDKLEASCDRSGMAGDAMIPDDKLAIRIGREQIEDTLRITRAYWTDRGAR